MEKVRRAMLSTGVGEVVSVEVQSKSQRAINTHTPLDSALNTKQLCVHTRPFHPEPSPPVVASGNPDTEHGIGS